MLRARVSCVCSDGGRVFHIYVRHVCVPYQALEDKAIELRAVRILADSDDLANDMEPDEPAPATSTRKRE
jgi:hypothetical protein